MTLSLKLTRIQEGIAFFDMYANAARVTGPCGISMRLSEVREFLLRIQPDLVEVDREMLTDHDFHRLAGLKAVRFI